MAKVYGIDRTIRELKQVEPDAIKNLRTELRSAAEPIALSIKAELPVSAPIRGMRHRGRTGWDTSRIKPTVKTNFSKRAANRGYSLVSIWVGGKKGSKGTAGLQIADMAGRGRRTITPQGRAMISALGANPSRYVWKSAERKKDQVEREILISLEKTSAKVNRNLVVNK